MEALRDLLDGPPNQLVDQHLEKNTDPFESAGKTHNIRVAAIARPQVDCYRLARALVNLSKADVDGKLLAKACKMRDRRGRNV